MGSITSHKAQPRKIFILYFKWDAPNPSGLHQERDSHFSQQQRNYSQLLVVGIVESCPLVLLVWLPLDGLEVGVQVGAVQAVIILNQAWGEHWNGLNPDFVHWAEHPEGWEPKEATGTA